MPFFITLAVVGLVQAGIFALYHFGQLGGVAMGIIETIAVTASLLAIAAAFVGSLDWR